MNSLRGTIVAKVMKIRGKGTTNYQKKKVTKRRISYTNMEPVPKDLRKGTIMSVDPGTQRLGWSISKVDFTLGGTKNEDSWLDYGTVFGKGKGCEIQAGIAAQVREIQEKYKVTHLVIEDYQLISGKTAGLFAVPSLIGVLKHDWFIRKGSEPIMINSQTWKYLLCGNGVANKEEAVSALLAGNHLSRQDYNKICKRYEQYELKKHRDPQDCFDAIAIDRYVKLAIQRHIKRETLEI